MARKKQEVLVLFPDVYTSTEKLTDAQFGALMRAAFCYRFEDVGYEGEDPLVDMAFGFVKIQLDRYKEVCRINQKNSSKPNIQNNEESEVQRNTAECSEMERNTPHSHIHNHTHNRNHIHNHNHIQPHSLIESYSMAEEADQADDTVYDTETNVTDIFVPPTMPEVMRYAMDNKIRRANPITFYEHYSENGWLDQGGKPVEDWKGLLHSWDRQEKSINLRAMDDRPP